MGWIIIGALIGYVGMYLCEEEVGMSFCVGFVCALVGSLVYFLAGGMIGCTLPLSEVVEEHEICALTDNSSVEGTHYLFSGYIDEELVCRYVVNTERGKHIEEIDMNYVYINEGDYTPTVKHYTYVLEKDWHKWFAHTAFLSDYYEFYVPENTVTNEYNIDLN